MKKSKILIIVLFIFEIIFVFLSFKSINNNTLEMNYKDNSNNMFAIMINDGDNNYINSDSIPKKGYIFNRELSGCIDDDNNKIEVQMKYVNGNVIVDTDITLYCYLYFDKNNDSLLAFASTNDIDVKQTASLSASDKENINYYYFGMKNPSEEDVQYIKLDEEMLEYSMESEVTIPGEYYFSVKDSYDEVTTIKKKFYESIFKVTNGSVSVQSVLTMEGNSFILPTPIPSSGYTVSTTWQGNGKTYLSGDSYSPTDNITFTSSGNPIIYSVRLSVENGSTTSINPQNVNKGGNATFTIVPYEGYGMSLSENSCNGVVSGNNFIVNNVNSNMDCKITLSYRKYNVSLEVSGGTLVGDSSFDVFEGESKEFSVNPLNNSVFKSVSCTNNQVVSYKGNNVFSIDNINANTVCKVVYVGEDNTFNYLENTQTYEVPYTGYYIISANGAKGNGNGGNGGKVSAYVYLKKGETVIINTGGVNGYNGGGTGFYNGGGSTTIRLNSKNILIAAGGGGGQNGTPGGTGTGKGGASSGGTGTNGGSGVDGLNGSGGGSGYNYTYKTNCSDCYTGSNTCKYGCDSVWDSCKTGSNTCTGGYVDKNCSDCYTGSNTCKYGCDSVWNSCKTGSNTCKGGYKTTTECKTWGKKNPSCGLSTKSACNNREGCKWRGTTNGSCIVDHQIQYCKEYKKVWDSCKTGRNTCKGGYEDKNCSNCYTGKNTCKYGCDSVYDSCKSGSNTCRGGYVDKNCSDCYTGSNTCKYGCDTSVTAYNSGNGGSNYIDSSAELISDVSGANNTNGFATIKFYKENK